MNNRPKCEAKSVKRRAKRLTELSIKNNFNYYVDALYSIFCTLLSSLSTLPALRPTLFALPSTFYLALLCLTLAQPLTAQIANGDEFTFVRIRWTDNNIRYGYGFSTNAELWAHDYPDAEENLYVAIKAATSIKVSEESEVLTFADEDIFKYPFLYACEIGYLTLSQAEINNLREYLMRGGFLVVDDFRWPFEWRNWVTEIRKVLPDCKLQRLSISHPIFHCFFDLNNIHAKTPYLEVPPEYWAMFDEDGRMLVIINFNNDVGDGWELPDSTPEFSTKSFKLGINYLVYSYTH